MFLVLVSSVGIIIPEHHCMSYVNGEIIEKPDGSCCDPNQDMPPDCCENELHCFWLEANFKSNQSSEILTPTHQVIHILPLENESLIKDLSFIFNHNIYSPPLLIRDILVSDQVFLL